MDTILSKIPSSVWLVLSACATLIIYLLSRTTKLLVKLPGPPATNWATGHFRSLFGIFGLAFREELVAKYGTTVKLNGAFGEEVIYTIDRAIMHSVLVQDRTIFERPQGAVLLFRSAFGGGGLLGMVGEEHRLHRKILTPVFTMKFLRERECLSSWEAKETCQGLRKDLAGAKDAKEVNVFPWMTSAALELLAEVGLGYSFNSFSGHRNGYKLAIREVMALLAKTRPFTNMLPYVYNLGRPTFRRFALNYNPIKIVRMFNKAVDVQNDLAEETISSRQKLIAEGYDLSLEPGRGRDFVTLLMKANEAEGSENHIDRQSMIGHMNVFVFAGHETISTGISRVLDILAKNPKIQDKLWEEVNAYFKEYHDSTDHNELLELPYLDGVIRETLHMHGPISVIIRANVEDTVLPLENPIAFALMELKVMVTELVHKFKFESSSQETSWAAFVIQLPFIKKEAASPGRLPKLPLRVTEIQSS